ncbi:MAG: flavin reductase family protein [Flavobacteriales bacterium]|nr:flavin reductase family protein [Flavobacteriales bacterium]
MIPESESIRISGNLRLCTNYYLLAKVSHFSTIDPTQVTVPELHGTLLGAIGPRPIALASTIDPDGRPNLSPFSFFNVFSANPPIAIFSPARRGRDNTTKHTYENVKQVPETVINVVNYALVQQTSLYSTEYPEGVNEFDKAGLTAIPSEKVKPFRVKESPVQLECKVKEVVELGSEGGAGNLVICEVVLIHVANDILNENGKIDQHKIDLVGRLGGNWYCRASGSALFEVEKPLTTLGIGIDAIPETIRHSHILTGNHLGQLGNVEQLPATELIQQCRQQEEVASLFDQHGGDEASLTTALHTLAAHKLAHNQVAEAWCILLTQNN